MRPAKHVGMLIGANAASPPIHAGSAGHEMISFFEDGSTYRRGDRGRFSGPTQQPPIRQPVKQGLRGWFLSQRE
jgi:hypothetical protein